MKTKLFLALAASAAITISGCSKSETLQTPEIKVTNLSTTSFSFTWTAIPDATGYTYEVKAANQSKVTDGNREKPENVEITGLSTASNIQFQSRLSEQGHSRTQNTLQLP